MIIAVPTGVKVFNWLFTMYGGRVRFTVPVLWSIGFMVTFVIGGMTGVLMAVPPADFQLHNSVFLVAHFHNVIIGGVVFGADGGLQLLVPQGIRLHARRTLGQGLVLVLVRRLLSRLHAALCGGPDGHDPAHAALRQSGLAAVADGGGGRRRHYPGRHRLPGRPARRVDPRPRAALRRDRRSVERPHAGMVDGVAAAGLEFCRPAARHRTDAFWSSKQRAQAKQDSRRQRATTSRSKCRKTAPTGFVTAFFAVVTGFALIWHIWWMAGLGLLGAFVTLLAFAFRDRRRFEVPAEQIARFDRAHQAEVAHERRRCNR